MRASVIRPGLLVEIPEGAVALSLLAISPLSWRIFPAFPVLPFLLLIGRPESFIEMVWFLVSWLNCDKFDNIPYP